jgi:hypothetical protein
VNVALALQPGVGWKSLLGRLQSELRRPSAAPRTAQTRHSGTISLTTEDVAPHRQAPRIREQRRQFVVSCKDVDFDPRQDLGNQRRIRVHQRRGKRQRELSRTQRSALAERLARHLDLRRIIGRPGRERDCGQRGKTADCDKSKHRNLHRLTANIDEDYREPSVIQKRISSAPSPQAWAE